MASRDKDQSWDDLDEVKKRLKAGKLTQDDLDVLEDLIKRAEESTKKLRAAIVE